MTGQQLKNSILQEAIEGRLVPQDPNDEPASVLLERIRAEKARLVKEKKIKKDKNESRIYRTDDGHWMEHFEDKNREDVCIDEEIPFDIPKGWEWGRISNLFIINPKVCADDNLSAAFIPMEKITACYSSLYTFDVKKWGSIKKSFTCFADGDIAFAKITPCFQNRKSMILEGLPNGIGAGTTELKIIRRIGNTVVRKYVLYFLKSSYFIEQAKFKGTANQQRIVVGYLENKLFPLPPFAEQHRIVEKIESLLPKVEAYGKAQEELEKLNEALPEQLKKSILQEAIEGRLVPQDPNDEPASVLLERIRAEKARLVKEKKIKKDKNESRIYRTEDGHWMEHFEDKNREDVCINEEIPFDVPKGWEWCRHNELFDISGGSQPPKNDFSLEKKEGYIRLFQIRDYGVKPEPVYIPISKASKITQKDDILLARYGGSLGKVFFAEEGAYNVAMAKVVYLFNKELINHKFLYYFYKSSLYQDLVRGNNRSAQGGFNKEDLNSLFFPLPPLAEQHRIVEKLEEILPKLNNLKKETEK